MAAASSFTYLSPLYNCNSGAGVRGHYSFFGLFCGQQRRSGNQLIILYILISIRKVRIRDVTRSHFAYFKCFLREIQLPFEFWSWPPLMGLPLFMLSLFFNRPYIVKNLERKIWSCFVCICLAKQRAWYKVMATPHRQDPQGSGRRGIRLYTSFSSLVSANWVLLQQQQSVGNGTGAMCHQHKRHGSLPTSAKRSIREDENGKREQPWCECLEMKPLLRHRSRVTECKLSMSTKYKLKLAVEGNKDTAKKQQQRKNRA